jgi:ACR3 family arsenite efflux pump ArsB
MLMVTPCTDWYLIFTGIANGNTALGASVLPLNLVLQIVLLPVYLLLFMGTEVSFGLAAIVNSIVLVLVVPLVAANTVKFLAKKFDRRVVLEKILKKADDIQFILLCLAIISMFASQGASLLGHTVLFIKLLPALLIFFGSINPRILTSQTSSKKQLYKVRHIAYNTRRACLFRRFYPCNIFHKMLHGYFFVVFLTDIYP